MAVVVAQLVEWLLPTPEVCCHRQNILNIYCQLYWKDEKRKKEAGIALLKKFLTYSLLEVT